MAKKAKEEKRPRKKLKQVYGDEEEHKTNGKASPHEEGPNDGLPQTEGRHATASAAGFKQPCALLRQVDHLLCKHGRGLKNVQSLSC
jgi:hypothetical protein